jgi:hypothetical protein
MAPDAPFDCPRCGRAVDARFYGPCERCRADLRATVVAVPRDVVPAAYEPAAHVTPNAVALRE